ncbi:UNVERIFIED_CONTAM: hypothetical protein Scaly_2773300 [Sesamum calycinum]|uniref:Reverse transcriptase domain-containing protein n=1 Tax=Sesamum calycinum TaxID=2727403 RepID=A0AAW2IYT9_9LAMI
MRGYFTPGATKGRNRSLFVQGWTERMRWPVERFFSREPSFGNGCWKIKQLEEKSNRTRVAAITAASQHRVSMTRQELEELQERPLVDAIRTPSLLLKKLRAISFDAINEILSVLEPKMSPEINGSLVLPFTPDEVQQALQQMYPYKSLIPDRLHNPLIQLTSFSFRNVTNRRRAKFSLRAAILWTINDLPAYGIVSGTLLNIDGKTKDTITARFDLQVLGIRNQLLPKLIENSYFVPPAYFTLSTAEKRKMCSFLASVKYLDGYATSLSERVNHMDYRVIALERGLGSDDMSDQAQVQVDPQEQSTKITNSEQFDATSNVTSSKKGRGITKGISVEKKRRKMEKLDAIVHPRRRRVVNDNAKNFNTEACVVLKQHAPLQYAHWKDIPIDSKKKMWLTMKYRSYRHKLHVFYLSNNDKEEILHKPPNGVSEEDWKKLIDYFESDGFQEDITRLQSQTSETGQEPIIEDEAFIKVLGPEKSSRLRGCGDGLKPPSKRGERINDELIKENEELRRQVEEDRECLESLQKDNKEMYKRLQMLESQVNNQEVRVHSQVQAIIKSQLPTIIRNLGIFGQIHQPANPKRGLRSPYLFLFSTELFSHLVQYEETRGALQRVAVSKNVPWVSHLLFANDTPIFAKETVEVLCIQGLLQRFEEVLGLAINWQKSHYLQQECGLRCRSKSVIFEHIKVRVWNKMQQWRISFLSQSVRSVLLKAVIQAIPSYVMSVFCIRDS